jgi:hypothetical protein
MAFMAKFRHPQSKIPIGERGIDVVAQHVFQRAIHSLGLTIALWMVRTGGGHPLQAITCKGTPAPWRSGTHLSVLRTLGFRFREGQRFDSGFFRSHRETAAAGIRPGPIKSGAWKPL